jgi:hypothetical protein
VVVVVVVVVFKLVAFVFIIHHVGTIDHKEFKVFLLDPLPKFIASLEEKDKELLEKEKRKLYDELVLV